MLAIAVCTSLWLDGKPLAVALVWDVARLLLSLAGLVTAGAALQTGYFALVAATYLVANGVWLVFLARSESADVGKDLQVA